MLAGVFVVVAGANSIQADEDWHVVERHTTAQAPADADTGAAPAARAAGPLLMACGELARPAGEPYKSIVAQLNEMWETSFPVYESVKSGSPHASRGGCIFYNERFMNFLLQRYMKIDEPDAVRPMLCARSSPTNSAISPTAISRPPSATSR